MTGEPIPNSEISRDDLIARLAYDPATGVFRWRNSGKEAGCVWGDRPYRRIMLNKLSYGAHRLAWLYVYGKWPDGEIDHINGIHDDNRICNLRDVTKTGNARNRRLRADNTHGAPGVYLNRETGRWYAQCCHGGKNRHLGSFPDFESAAAARRKFQIEHGYHENHGR